jgi:xanthine dehydrogenase/oxidase
MVLLYRIALHEQMSGALHCTGEAVYTDDIPLPPGTLHGSLILSNQCGAEFVSMDTAPALKIPGVFAVYTAEDITILGGKNILGPIVKDEVVFLPVGEKVRTVGQVLGIVVAETLERAELGARMVEVKYGECTEKIIVSIADAIEANSFYEMTRHVLERGDLTAIESLKEHFYLETNSTLAIPSESDTNLTIYSGTQALTKTQTFCASCTGTQAAKVVVRMKRIGGGFGGKETRSVFISCAAAVAAKRSSRPVRLSLPRDQDMSTTGTRHAFVSRYNATAEVTEDGVKLRSLDIQLYNNGGCGLDLSGPIMDRALFHVDGCYFFPNFRAQGIACKTVQAPHTAYRGFGGPQVSVM